MQLIDAISKVIELQNKWSSSNTGPMQERGKVVRDIIPKRLRELKDELSGSIKLHSSDLLIEGRDGTGLKSAVPWIRFGSELCTPSATVGWYCVFLFHPKGKGVYLCLSHGSTRLSGGDFKPRSKKEAASLMEWGEKIVASELSSHRLMRGVDLSGANKLARAYEKTTLASYFYESNELPDIKQLTNDMVFFGGMLGKIYREDRFGRSPEAREREFEEAQILASSSSSGRASKGSRQGYGLTADERKAVEMAAMKIARQYLVERGYRVRDVSSNRPYDLAAERDDKAIIVEVKGTTGFGESVILTNGEVEAHKAAYPNNALIVVHSIQLRNRSSKPKAFGGIKEIVMPWKLELKDLRAISYQYQRR